MINPQMKKGLLEVCILSVLQRGDSYGYKIIKDLSDYIKLSESTLYPILRRLEASGYLMVYTVEHNSRLRKMYKNYRYGYKADQKNSSLAGKK